MSINISCVLLVSNVSIVIVEMINMVCASSANHPRSRDKLQVCMGSLP